MRSFVRCVHRIFLVLALLGAGFAGAHGQTVNIINAERPSSAFFSEVRIGALYHDAPIGGHHREDGGDINLESLFGSPDFLQFLLAPRPFVGVDLNSNGDTDSLFAGLNWQFALLDAIVGQQDQLFFGLGLGGAVHDGKLNGAEADRKALGSRILFHEEADFGYRFAPRQNISIYFDHMSNAGLAHRNEGLSNIGMRLGFSF